MNQHEEIGLTDQDFFERYFLSFGVKPFVESNNTELYEVEEFTRLSRNIKRSSILIAKSI